ncbi:MAG: YqaJ viral recombinase family protein [Eubacterium sp.]|nr:YqaJ viral recombinase family protein [Eubacterium sp.]
MPKIIVKTAGLSRDEWLEYRRKGIGGSDAAIICGLNPWSSLVTLWADKMGTIPDKADSEAMRQGRDLEDYVAQRFAEATGKKVRRRNAMFRHDDYEFLTANIDREIVGENAGLECKTTTQFNKSDFENGEIPLYYLCQCRHYMNVMGYDRMYLAVLVTGSAFYWFVIDHDAEEEAALQQLEIDFWNDYVVPEVCPPPDGSEVTTSALGEFAREDDSEAMMLEHEELADSYFKLGKEMDRLKKEREEVKQQLILNMSGAARGCTVNYKLSFASSERNSVDSKKLKAKYPEIYREVLYTSSVRQFRLTERK